MVEINNDCLDKLTKAIQNLADQIDHRPYLSFDELIDVLREIRDELNSLGSVLVGVGTAIGYLEKVEDEK